MTTTVLAGSTGLVGSNILSQLLAHPTFSAVYAYTRRELPNPDGSTKIKPLTSPDTSNWIGLFPRDPVPKIMFSGLGTTRAAAGSVEAQRKIDLDLNLVLAKSAKEAGVETYVLISSSGANSGSPLAYPKMKGELEDAVKALGFKHTVILRPGLLVGERTESRPAEAVFRGVAKSLRSLAPALINFWAQDASVVARAAINAGIQCMEDRREPGIWEMGQSSIVSLGQKS